VTDGQTDGIAVGITELCIVQLHCAILSSRTVDADDLQPDVLALPVNLDMPSPIEHSTLTSDAVGCTCRFVGAEEVHGLRVIERHCSLPPQCQRFAVGLFNIKEL